ncbi:F0F1 ATP synthase subunit delta [Sodalis sp. CWE]|uniref:F0F1 ATP synthase subunit delta n=1 Tax=Sodalis sp. CWE TaxID=2803816 RepID=UPI001C7D2EE7|nr:F0F1 ATP synthase subunit delta [Sodalis sp. CWE]MBX4181101.1 F0F1 ATP synthase subunit delta [Sodalis sp. CWE]
MSWSSKMETIARPYSKAVFDFAVEHRSVSYWQEILTFCVMISRNERITKLLSGSFSHQKQAEIFIAICGNNLDFAGKNLIKIMSKNRRLIVLPNVLKQFISLRMEQEKIIEVEIISASSLREEQLVKIMTIMQHRFSSKVKLNCKIDPSIVAGVIIRTGDMVINSSVRGYLNCLSDFLQS